MWLHRVVFKCSHNEGFNEDEVIKQKKQNKLLNILKKLIIMGLETC